MKVLFFCMIIFISGSSSSFKKFEINSKSWSTLNPNLDIIESLILF